jgi:glycosyltransferase involved in cell wall biosynthesis
MMSMAEPDFPPLRIAQVAPLRVSVPPVDYGGTQRIVHLLTEELVRRGHQVTLFASGDSQTSGCLRPISESSLYEAMRTGKAVTPELYQLSGVTEAIRDARSFDLIHCQLGCLPVPLNSLSPVPLLHSAPLPFGADDLWLLARYPDVPLTCRSYRQIAGVPPARRDRIRVVYNGCDFSRYQVAERPGRYLAFLGRMAWEKNAEGAIAIARQAGMPILLAGEPRAELDRAYFEQSVKPLIDGKDVVWIGPVDDGQKNEFFQDAAALVFPIRWDEPFGIVMIEAMACGVPVLASNRGSVSEVVEPGKTGYYADTLDELAMLIPRVLELDRRAVRQHAMRRFSHTVMAGEYLRVYAALLGIEEKQGSR